MSVKSRPRGRTGPASRLPTAAAFAVYAGVAPIEIASADKTRHRLLRHGDRKLNNASHIIALTQVRMHSSRARVYYDGKIVEGQTHNEAMRCLERRLADHVGRTMTSANVSTRRAQEDIRGRLCNPARPAQPRQLTLRTSHFPSPPATTLQLDQLDQPRGTPVARTPWHGWRCEERGVSTCGGNATMS